MKNTTDTNSRRTGKHTATSRTIDKISATLSRRHKADRIFRMTGAAAVGTSLLFIALLFGSIFYNGYTAFFQTRINLEIFFDPAEVIVTEGRVSGNFNALVHKALDSEFGQPDSRDQRRKLYGMISQGAVYELGEMVERDPSLIGTSRPVWLLADDDIDMLAKGHIDRSLPEDQRRIDNIQLEWVEQLESSGAVRTFFNSSFFLSADSREPEMAGILGALTGSLFTLFITLTLSVPIGVAAAIYLEEFAPKNRWTDLIEVNINNLAAVPSIVFGLLGLSIFLVFFGLPRSAPLVGGMVLTLMTLPTIIISSRSALKSVPRSIRDAALSVGASDIQTVFHHVLPQAVPGIMTGTIIGMAQALGETAPLLMIGMVAFIVDIPSDLFDPATVLPVQIFLWADSPERAFVEKTSGAIMILLGFLVLMNLAAVIIRKRFEYRW
ncbi:phosphate ABC transporter permease PstA [Prosthecochloris sp. HL-130-GSB]|uniref:phosphate ABC transporter permease PstA n=1 Tax=Prosthecochloris sp. HL-130-GSB TaxID=1974213 RepID=UPI001E304043|nr:phosphate ABC transporter permease PstA [Prosthecochloris sp. HL-130-GSB]